MVDTFRPKGGATVVLRPQRQRASGASAVGQGLAQLGQSLNRVAAITGQAEEEVANSQQRIAEIEQGRARARTIATGAGRLATIEAELDAKLDQLPERKQPGALGYAAKAKEVIAETYSGFLSELGDDEEVLNRFNPIVQAGMAKRGALTEEYERKSSAGYQVDSYALFQNTEADALRRNPSAEGLSLALQKSTLLRDGLDLDGNAKARMERADRALFTTAALEGMVERGQYDAVKAALADPALDGVLEPKARDLLGRMVEGGVAAQEREAALAAAEAQRTAREAVRALKVQMEYDPDKVTAGDVRKVLGQAQAAGLPEAELLEAGYLGQDMVVAKQLRGLATPALESELRRLRGLADQGQLKGSDARLLKMAEGQLKARDSQNGARLQPLLKGDVAQQRQGVDQLAAMPFSERKRAAQEAGDVRAGLFAGTSEQGRLWGVQGRAARAARKDDFAPPKVGTRTPDEQIKLLIDTELGDLKDELGGEYDDFREAALDMMAGQAGKWSQDSFKTMVQVLFGATFRNGKRYGGIGTIEGRKVELPPRWTEADFATRFARKPLTGAVNGDGTPANAAVVKRNYQLRFVDEDPATGNLTYVLEGPDRRLLQRKNAKGELEPYQLIVSREPM